MPDTSTVPAWLNIDEVVPRDLSEEAARVAEKIRIVLPDMIVLAKEMHHGGERMDAEIPGGTVDIDILPMAYEFTPLGEMRDLQELLVGILMTATICQGPPDEGHIEDLLQRYGAESGIVNEVAADEA